MSIQPNPSSPLWPAEWQGCRITGQFIDFTGQPVAGSITLTPTAAVVIAGTSKRIAVGSGISIDLDVNGAFDLTVPATDDPHTNPTGWTYSVVENFPGGRSYSIDAPMNATRDLTAIVPVPDASGVAITRGESAYETAVRLGYSGTQTQWLASLQGSGLGRIPQIASYMGPSYITASAGSSSAFDTGDVPATLYVVGRTMTVDQIGFRVTTAQAAMNAKALLYGSDASGFPSGAPLINSGALSCAATGDQLATVAPVTLTPGLYWGFIRSNAGTTVRFMGCNQTQPTNAASTTANIWQAPGYMLANPGTYAAPAAITTWSYSFGPGNGTFPLLFLRRSA